MLILVLGGGGGYDVGTPFDPFPSQPQPADNADRMDTAPDAESQLIDFLSFVTGDLQTFWAADFQKAGRAFEPTRLVALQRRDRHGLRPGLGGRPARSTARSTAGSTSTRASSASSPTASGRRATSPRPTCSRTSTAITSRPSPGSPGRSTAPRGRTPTSATRCRCGSSSRRTASPACGRTRRSSAGLLEEGDLEEGLTAAASVGDDRIQAAATGRISPETFTHGTAEQRAGWFKRGFEDGDATACDTFSGDI